MKRGWKGHTRIKSLSHSYIEHNFFYTTCTKLHLAHAFVFERAQCPLCARSVKIVIFDRSMRSGWFPHGGSLSPERSKVDKNTRVMITLFAHVYRTLFFLTECVKLACLFVLHAQSSLSHTACSKVNWSAHARFLRTPCVKELLCARKTNTRRVSHTPFKNSYFRYKCAKWVILARV